MTLAIHGNTSIKIRRSFSIPKIIFQSFDHSLPLQQLSHLLSLASFVPLQVFCWVCSDLRNRCLMWLPNCFYELKTILFALLLSSLRKSVRTKNLGSIVGSLQHMTSGLEVNDFSGTQGIFWAKFLTDLLWSLIELQMSSQGFVLYFIEISDMKQSTFHWQLKIIQLF